MNYGIGNVKAKGGGDAELNIEYGLTPPSDTSKIWVKCDTPSKVKIEANRELIVSSNENAKKIETEAIAETYIYSSGTAYNAPTMIKFNDGTMFFVNGTVSSSYSKVLGTSGIGLFKVKNGVVTQLYSGNSNTLNYGIYKTSDTSFIWIFKTSSSAIQFYNYSNDGTLVKNFTKTNANTINVVGFDVANNLFYMFYDSSGYKLQIIDSWNSGASTTTRTITIPLLSGSYYISNNNGVVYNGYFYFLLPHNTSTTKINWLMRINLSTFECEEVKEITDFGLGSYKLRYSTNLLYSNKMILTNIAYSTSNYANYIAIIDLTTLNIEKINLAENYYCAYTYVDATTGDIELWGGYPTATIGLQKRIIYNIYELEENTLDLFYDTYFTKNIRLIDSPSLTIDAPIDHAWLGDSNDIAQAVDMFYYENGLWWGVNCLGWTELESVAINANDITTNENSIQQSFSLSPVWANQSGICLVRGSGTYSEVYNRLTIPIASLDTDELIELCITKGTDISSNVGGLPIYMYTYRSSVIAETFDSETSFLACDFIVDATYQAILSQMNITSNIGDRVKACYYAVFVYGNELGLALLSSYLYLQTSVLYTFTHPDTWTNIQDDIITSLRISTYSNRDLSPFDLTNATIEYMIEFYCTGEETPITDSLSIEVYDEYGLKATKTISITYSSE